MRPPVLPKPFEPIEPIDISKPPQLLVWLMLVKHHVTEALDAGEDALRSPSKRKLTRREAAYRLALGRRNFLRLHEAAQLAIPPGTSLPSPPPDADPPSTGRRGSGGVR